MTDDILVDQRSLYEETRDRYLQALAPIFFPTDPLSHDIVRYFASLLRVSGMEDKGWDPYLESRSILEDLNRLMKLDLSSPELVDGPTIWRLGLIIYNQILEMGAPYEMIANLLRFRLKQGYSPNPFYKFMTSDEKKRFKRSGLYTRQKIEIIQKLSNEADLRISSIFDEFVRFDIRNAIAHADYVITDEAFRCRGGPGKSFVVPLDEMDRLITAAKAFASAFFILEEDARRTWGANAGRAIPYDPHYKGLMEVLADEDGLLVGFKVHWPNGADSCYRRSAEGIDMVNCLVAFDKETIELFVGMYAVNPGHFSPLVERGAAPKYSSLQGSSEEVRWDSDAAAARQDPLPEVNYARR